MAETSTSSTFRARARSFAESNFFQRFILTIIVVNSVVLGLETSEAAMEPYGSWLVALDDLALTIFIAEILLKLYAMGLSYFRDPWNIFDFTIVAIALLPFNEGFAVLRALRILRAFRLISMVPKMRLVVQAFLKAIPGMASIMLLMVLVFYVFAVIAFLAAFLNLANVDEFKHLYGDAYGIMLVVSILQGLLHLPFIILAPKKSPLMPKATI